MSKWRMAFAEWKHEVQPGFSCLTSLTAGEIGAGHRIDGASNWTGKIFDKISKSAHGFVFSWPSWIFHSAIWSPLSVGLLPCLVDFQQVIRIFAKRVA